MSPPVQELPDSYKSVRFLSPPLRGRHAESSCPTNRLSYPRRRGRRPRRPACRNYRLRTNSFVCAVCRFADGTPSRRALRIVYRSCSVGRDHWARRNLQSVRGSEHRSHSPLVLSPNRLPRRLRSRSRGTSVTDAAYPLRVFAPRNDMNGQPRRFAPPLHGEKTN